MDVARATMGQGWPFVAGLWNDDGVSEPWRSQGRMNGRTVLVTFAKTKVTRPGGRNQKHQQKRGNSEQAQEQPTPNCQYGVKQAVPQSRCAFSFKPLQTCINPPSTTHLIHKPSDVHLTVTLVS